MTRIKPSISEIMNNDYPDNYLLEKRLAAQIEAEWSDVLLGDFIETEIPPAGRLSFSEYLVGPTYYHAVADWISSELGCCENIHHVTDIGAGLGRFLYELVHRLPHIESATYVEPSSILFRWATEILCTKPKVTRVPFLKGIGQVGWHDQPASTALDAERLCKIHMVKGSAEALVRKDTRFDLVVALNVLDQCAYPSQLAKRICTLAAPRGYIAFSVHINFRSVST